MTCAQTATCGLATFRQRTLRRSCQVVQGRTPLFALQELAGWETEKMVRRYAHLAAEHLAAYAGNTESHGTTTAQAPDFHGTPRLQIVGKQ
jgi:hypothetical protein